jgi:hypothetical protein
MDYYFNHPLLEEQQLKTKVLNCLEINLLRLNNSLIYTWFLTNYSFLLLQGRISRYVANKCSLAARIDNFATVPCNIFGEKLRNQVRN